MKPSREKQVAAVEHFASLWEQFFNLYLNEEEFEDISSTKESEFLGLQASIMQESGAVVEYEEGRFSLADEVASVINEAVSLRHLKGQSDFQVRRRKERGRQVRDLIGKVKSFVAERDTTVRRQEREIDARLSRPFWDPEKGKFAVILGRIVVSPIRFFSAVRVAGESRKANTFLLTLLSLLMLGCVATLVAFNAKTASAISFNATVEMGILTSKDTAGATVVIWIFVLIGTVMVSLAGAIVAVILAHLFGILSHAGFKIVGGKKDMVASHKVVAFGLSPLLLLVLLPALGYLVKVWSFPAFLLAAIPILVLCYIAVLQVIGVHKVHGTSVGAGIAGCLIAFLLFAGILFLSLYVWHAAAGNLPPSSGQYVYVTAEQTAIWKGREQVRSLKRGEVLEFVEEKDDYYLVRSGEDEGRLRKEDAQLREASIWSLPGFLVRSSVSRAEALVDRLSREIKKGAA
jgi:hypothetical protein